MIDFSRFRSEIVSCSALAAFPLGNRFLLGARGISARKFLSARRSSHFRSEISFCSALAAFPHGNHFLLGARLISAKLAEFPPDFYSFVSLSLLFFCGFVFFYGLENYALFTSVSERNFVSIANVQKIRQPHIALPKKLTKFLQNFRFPLPFWKKCTVFAPFHRAFFPFR